MSDLAKLLNEPETLNPTESIIPKQITKPTAAANKAHCLADQDICVAAASVGSHIFRSAATYLAANPVVIGYKK
jgi:hypothetical protein